MGVGPGVIGLRALGAHEPCGALRAHEPRDLLTPRLAFVPSTSNLLYVVSSANVTRNFFTDAHSLLIEFCVHRLRVRYV